MIRLLLPLVAVLLIAGCLLLNGQGLKSLGDSVVVVAILFIIGVSCVPLFRRARRLKRWLAKVPWLPVLLVWNGLGGLVVLFVLCEIDFANSLPETPEWLMAVFFWLWFLPMPFTTLGATVVLWKGRKTFVSRVLLLYCWVVFAFWCLLMLMPAVIMAKT
jgi:hypothetical protein